MDDVVHTCNDLQQTDPCLLKNQIYYFYQMASITATMIMMFALPTVLKNPISIFEINKKFFLLNVAITATMMFKFARYTTN